MSLLEMVNGCRWRWGSDAELHLFEGTLEVMGVPCEAVQCRSSHVDWDIIFLSPSPIATKPGTRRAWFKTISARLEEAGHEFRQGCGFCIYLAGIVVDGTLILPSREDYEEAARKSY